MVVVEGGHLTAVGHRMVHMGSVAVAHASLTLHGHSIGSVRVEVRPLDHGVGVAEMAVIMLLVRTLVVHVSVFTLVGLPLPDRWGAVGPVAGVRAVLCAHGRAHLVRSVGRVVDLALTRFLTTPRIQI